VAAAAAITPREHAAEALLEGDMPQGDMPGVDTPAVAMLGLEWGRLELDGAVLTGPAIGTVVAIGTAPTMAVIGAVAITGMAITGTATIGTAIIGIMGIIIMAMMWSSSAASAFRGGGAGGLRGDGTTATHTPATAIIRMATAAPTPTAPAMAMGMTTLTAVISTVMATGMETAPSISPIMVNTATAADPESPSCNGGCHELAITMDPSTASWGRKHGAQSGRTSKTTITQVNRRHSGHADREAAIIFSVDWPAVS